MINCRSSQYYWTVLVPVSELLQSSIVVFGEILVLEEGDRCES
uniref:Uncharacterized protein n=1 Tax=Heterorhabditis bacteriophora TaxID=37862 RepID=A0A1I7WGB1_HETBA